MAHGTGEIVPMGIGRLWAAVACALVLTAPSTAAAISVRHYQPAVMTMQYTVDGLHAVVHAPRTLVGTLPLVFGFRGYEEIAQSLARKGTVVVVVDDRLAVDRHRQWWRSLSKAQGPLVERFCGFASHIAVAEP